MLKVAFICVHNSCRSQIAEALGRHLASDVFESYSAGTERKDRINPDAVRLMKQFRGIDMEAEGQHSDLPLLERIADVVRRDLPQLTVSSIQNAQNWGSEDISLMMNRVQAHGGLATYMRVMTPMAGAQHTVTFDFDEEVLPRSVMVFAAAALDVLSEGCK